MKQQGRELSAQELGNEMQININAFLNRTPYLSVIQNCLGKPNLEEELDLIFKHMQEAKLPQLLAYACFLKVYLEESDWELCDALADNLDRFVGWVNPDFWYKAEPLTREETDLVDAVVKTP